MTLPSNSKILGFLLPAVLGGTYLYMSQSDSRRSEEHRSLSTEIPAINRPEELPLLVKADFNPPNQLDELILQPSMFHTKPLVMHFWATWCGICREEKPLLQRLAGERGHRDFLLVGVPVEDETSAILDYEQRSPHGYPIVDDRKGLIARQFDIQSVPRTMIFKPSGELCKRLDRPLRAAEMDALIQAIESCRS